MTPQKKKTECQCKLCGHKWAARTENPKACPNCKRYDWNTDK
jgi:rubrerythrin